ncbi:MAG: rane protein [Nevskia sp.]|nr:rane protein [Nevskia sp.]
MKIATYLLGFIGLAVAVVLVLHHGWSAVAVVLAQGGWGLFWLVPFHALPLILDTFGWRMLLAPSDPAGRAPTPYLFWVATIREAANRLLPVANIGGEVIGIRLVILRGIDGATVTASVIIEVLLTLLNQYVFTAFGLVLLILLTHATHLTSTILIGLALSLPIPLGLLAALRYGSVFARMERLVERLLGSANVASLLGGANLDEAIRAVLAHRGRLIGCMAWQLACYVLGAFECWLALRLLGHEITPWAAITLEAMTQAVRHFIFFVPAGLGVQEGGLIVFGQLIGLPTDVAVALSLTKRAREVAFGLPALISWQWLEGTRLRRLWSRPKHTPEAPTSGRLG